MTTSYIPLPRDLDYINLFDQVRQNYDTAFLLESCYELNYESRYVIIGFEPEFEFYATGQNIQIIFNEKHSQTPNYTKELILELIQNSQALNSSLLREVSERQVVTINLKHDNPYRFLEQIHQLFETKSTKFCGGLIGSLGYESINYFEPTANLPENSEFPTLSFGFYQDGIIFDKYTGCSEYFYRFADRQYLLQSLFVKSQESTQVRFVSQSQTQDQHSQMVLSAKQEILKGNAFQCVIGIQYNYEITGDKFGIYKTLRTKNPSPYMFYLQFGNTPSLQSTAQEGNQKIMIGASPELVFKLENGLMENYPLAGTRKRGKTTAEDQDLTRDLLSDPKEIAEHNMLVDLHRNDIGRVAKIGTVKIKRLMDIKKFATVQHISSEIMGIMDDKQTIFTALASNFPAGTLSGAPKLEAIKIIQRLEQDSRGPYGGAVGYFGSNNNGQFCIPIRSLFIDGNKGFARAGGGIVFDSNTDDEYQEIINKLGAITKTLEGI